ALGLAPSWLSIAVTHAREREVIRTHYDSDHVAEQNSNAESTHFSAGVGEHLMSVVEADRVLHVAHRVDYGAIHFDRVTLGHQTWSIPVRAVRADWAPFQALEKPIDGLASRSV